MLSSNEHSEHPDPQQRSQRMAGLERFVVRRWRVLADDPAGGGLRLDVLQEVEKMLICGGLGHGLKSKGFTSKEDHTPAAKKQQIR